VLPAHNTVSFRGSNFLLRQLLLSRNFIWDLPLSKLYTNSLLSTLNSRAGWNNLTGTEAGHSVLFREKQSNERRAVGRVCMFLPYIGDIPSLACPPQTNPSNNHQRVGFIVALTTRPSLDFHSRLRQVSMNSLQFPWENLSRMTLNDLTLGDRGGRSCRG